MSGQFSPTVFRERQLIEALSVACGLMETGVDTKDERALLMLLRNCLVAGGEVRVEKEAVPRLVPFLEQATQFQQDQPAEVVLPLHAVFKGLAHHVQHLYSVALAGIHAGPEGGIYKIPDLITINSTHAERVAKDRLWFKIEFSMEVPSGS